MDFTGLVAIFASSFVIALSGALMPGPLLAVTVRHASRRGFVAAPMLVLGHAVAEAALMIFLMFGLIEWLKGDASIAVISIAGSCMLLWMAAGMAAEARKSGFASADENVVETPKALAGKSRAMLDGVLASVSNPYWFLWWATIGLGYLLLASGRGASGAAAFFLGHISADAAWYLFVGWGVSAGRERFTDRSHRVLIGVCAVFIAFCACSFGYHGIMRLVRVL